MKAPICRRKTKIRSVVDETMSWKFSNGSEVIQLAKATVHSYRYMARIVLKIILNSIIWSILVMIFLM